MKKSRKKRKKSEKILNIFELLKAFILKGLRLLKSHQKLKNKKYLKKFLTKIIVYGNILVGQKKQNKKNYWR